MKKNTSKTIIEKTKNHFLDLYTRSGNTNPYPKHVERVEEIAEELHADFPNSNKEVILLSVWLHDIGTFLGDREIHDISSENEARKYLTAMGLKSEVIEQVAHCVRSHRCNDVLPATIEAKILAVADSVSHLYAGPYINMKHKFGKEAVLGKLKRDYRDIGLIPGLKKKLTPLYKAWKNLLEIIPD